MLGFVKTDLDEVRLLCEELVSFKLRWLLSHGLVATIVRGELNLKGVYRSVNEPIEISFQYSKSDIINAWRYYRSTFRIVKLGKPLAVFLVLLGIWFYYKYGRILDLVAFFFFALEAWFDLFADLRCWLSYRAKKKIYNENNRNRLES